MNIFRFALAAVAYLTAVLPVLPAQNSSLQHQIFRFSDPHGQFSFFENCNLDLQIVTPGAAVNLCSTTDYQVVTLTNSRPEAVFGAEFQVQLPAGASVVQGSCEMAYPASGAWQSITDPGPAAGFGVGWSLASASPLIAQNGLAAVQQAPMNSIAFRFRLRLDCGFQNGSALRYRAFAEPLCPGGPNDASVLSGQPIMLAGVAPLPSVSINLTAGLPMPIDCSDELPVNISFNSSAASEQRDSLVVALPPGAFYVQNSFQPGLNAPVNQPFTQQIGDRQFLKWKLKNGVAANQTVSLGFAAKGFGAAGCGTADTIFVKTTQPQISDCNGMSCEIQAATGQAALPVAVLHPQFKIHDFDINFDAGVPSYQIDIENLGTTLHIKPTIFKFYRDNDASATLTPGDLKLMDDAIFFPLGPGDVIGLAKELHIDLADLCHLIVVMEAQDICLCETVALPVDSITRTISPKTVCSGAFINLGVFPNPGHQYRWTPSTWLECDTCSFPMFNYENDSNQPVMLEYHFTESAGDCMVSSDVQATVLPNPHILNQDTSVCPGEPVTITTTPAVQYEWFGSGIANPSLPTQTVSPIATSIYFVKLTDSFGCQDIDTLKIEILPQPFAEIGPDTLGVCGNTPLQFDAFFNSTYSYQWQPAAAVSNPGVHNPFFTASATTTLVLTTTIAGSSCFDRDTVFVGFSENPNIEVSIPALSNCFGDTAFVQMTGDAQDYFWAPSAGVFCQNNNCSQVALSPEVSTTYTIVGYNMYGCKDTATLAVNVPGKISATTEHLQICAGEVATIFGVPVSQPGVFCKNFSGIGGCDSTHCVFLSVLDTVLVEQQAVLCPGEKFTIGGVTYEQAGRFCRSDFSVLTGCDSTFCLTVTAAEAPQLDAVYEISGEQGTPLQLSLPGGFSSYDWSPTEHLSCSDCASPTANFPADLDSFFYKIKVTNTSGCTAETSYRVLTFPPCRADNVLIPNAFTPNGDDTNDRFQLKPSEGMEQLLSLQIFNRWGEKIFTTNRPETETWDGSDGKGNLLPSEVYLYILEVGCPAGVEKRSGEVTLLR